MKHDYTYNFLLKFIYKETSLTRSLEIENAIREDKTVSLQYQRLLEAFRMIPKVKFYPSEDSIKSVLNYSSNEQLRPSFQ